MLSIDIGSQKVCIIEGNYHKGQAKITSCGEIEYAKEVVVNGEIRDRATLCFIINEIIKTNHMNSKSAIVTINSSNIISRELKLPEVKLPDLEQLVRSEMIRIIGSDGDFVIDFVVTGETSDKMLTITAYAMTKDLVESYCSIIKDCKLSPYALDTHANAMSKLLSKAVINGEQNDGNVIVADIGYTTIGFHGFCGGVCKFNRTEVSPVQGFVRELSDLKRTEFPQKMMQELDLFPDYNHEDATVSATCKYFVSHLADEIQKYNQYIIMGSSEKILPKIYICGGVASVKNIDVALSDSLKHPIERLNSVRQVTLPENCSLSKACNAAGALIRIKK